MKEKKFNKYEYDRAYHAEHYWRFNIAIPKEMKDVIDTAAKEAGLSKNAWLKQAIEEKLERDHR